MKLDCCDKCKNFSKPGIQSIRLWSLRLQTNILPKGVYLKTQEVPEVHDEENFELCNDCREKFLKAIAAFWQS